MLVSQLPEVFGACLYSGIPLMLWGPPGVGKSWAAMIAAMMIQKKERKRLKNKKIKIDITTLTVCTKNPVDIGGFPTPGADGLMHFLPIAQLPQSGSGILVMEELPSALPSVQTACYELILEHRIGDYKLPCRCHHPELIGDDGPGWMISACGNRMQDGAYTFEMPTPLRNRMMHISVTTNAEIWRKWARENDIDERVIGYISMDGKDALMDFDPQREEYGFATPRSWHKVSDLIKVKDHTHPLFKEMCQGLIGQGYSIKFVAYCKLAGQIPNALGVLDGETPDMPSDPSIAYAFCGAIINAVFNQWNEEDKKSNGKALKSAKNIITYTVNKLGGEYAALVTRDMFQMFDRKMIKKLTFSSEFGAFESKFGSVLSGLAI